MGPEVKDYRSNASAIWFPEPLNSGVPVRTPRQKNRKMRIGRDIKKLKDEIKKKKDGGAGEISSGLHWQQHDNINLHELKTVAHMIPLARVICSCQFFHDRFLTFFGHVVEYYHTWSSKTKKQTTIHRYLYWHENNDNFYKSTVLH